MKEKVVQHFVMCPSFLSPAQPLGSNSWKESRPSKVPMAQICFLNEWLERYTYPLRDSLT